MADALFSPDDYQVSLQALMPRGRIWPRDPTTVQGAAAAGLAQSGYRLDAGAQSLLVDAFPATAVELLAEWEATLGLPDPCAGEDAILSQRQGQVVARFASAGGQSVAYFTDFCAQLGFEITITQFAPAVFGQAQFGMPYMGAEWAFVWQVNAPLDTTGFARFGAAVFGDPYSASGNSVLECELNARNPAHTTLLFNYIG
jgi:uncharacterized protein YmfQ (DUF2313 family)